MLEELKGKLSPGQLRFREDLFKKAATWIQDAGRAGGVSAPTSKSWKHPDSKTMRIDIEVIKGVAFVRPFTRA
jgi:hypothetical protein